MQNACPGVFKYFFKDGIRCSSAMFKTRHIDSSVRIFRRLDVVKFTEDVT